MTPASPIDTNGESEHPDSSESPTTITEARRDQRSAFEDAAQAVAGGESPRPGDPAPFGSEIRNLEEWARRQGRLIPDSELDRLDMVSNSPSSYFGWFRPTDGTVIVDAKPDNFIRTSAGLIPIDLQIAQFSLEQMKAAGLTSDSSAPIIFIPR